MKKSLLIPLLALGVCLAEGSAAGGSPPVRADFDDSLDPITSLPVYRIRSDGKGSPCGYDYADVSDTGCSGDTYSFTLGRSDYFLRSVINQSPTPSRWLVLDFSEPIAPSVCPDVDVALLSYPGRNPAAVSPVNTDPCTDYVEVRLFGYGAFKPGATSATFRIIIDGPDLMTSKGKNATTYNQWNTKYELVFVNPVPIIARSADGKSVVLSTGAMAAAELRVPATGQVLGTFNMPFQLALTR